MVTREFDPAEFWFTLVSEAYAKQTMDGETDVARALMDQAEADVRERGWDPADCRANLTIYDDSAELIDRNQYRLACEVVNDSLRPQALGPTKPREEAPMSEQPTEKETHVEETREETTTETPAPGPPAGSMTRSSGRTTSTWSSRSARPAGSWSRKA